MTTSLAAQLAQIAAKSKETLNVKAQKAAHSKSLIWEAKDAATQSLQAVFAICLKGFEELCQLDARFGPFRSTLFSDESVDQDRFQLTADENAALDQQIEIFLRLMSSRIRLMPAIKCLEWLIRRFRIHEENISIILTTFLPYHSSPAFATLMSILPPKIPQEYRFLDPYIRSTTNPPRAVLVHRVIHSPDLLTLISTYTLESCKKAYDYPALIAFWAGLMTEGVSGITDRTRSGRAAIQNENTQNLLHRVGPIFAEALVMKKAPSLQIASYMALAIYISKANLGDVAVHAFMQQVVHGWTNHTIKEGLVCLTILAQFQSAKQMNSRITKALTKIPDIGPLLVEISRERRVDRLAHGFCLALIERFNRKNDLRGLSTISVLLKDHVLQEKQIAEIFKGLLVTALELDDDHDKDGVLRRELGSALIELSKVPGKPGVIIQSVLEDSEFDIEALELKLDLSFRAKSSVYDVDKNNAPTESNTENMEPATLSEKLDKLLTDKVTLPTFFKPLSDDFSSDLRHLFFSIVSELPLNEALLSKFDNTSILRRQTAFKDCTYCNFYVQIWCGPHPALGRAAALNMVKDRLKAESDRSADVQALVPYCVVALHDQSKRVRQAAAELMKVLADRYAPPLPARVTVWGAKSFYGKGATKSAPLGADVGRVLLLQILPNIEECVVDPSQVLSVVASALTTGKYSSPPQPAIDKKDHMSHSVRSAVLSFFASHLIATPILLVKYRLLRALNEVQGIGSTSRTQFLISALRWWMGLSAEDVSKLCHEEALDQAELDASFVDIVTPNDTEGVDLLFKFLSEPRQDDRQNLVQAIFARIKRMWSLMTEKVKFHVAGQLLDISQEQSDKSESAWASFVSGEAGAVLRELELPTTVLSSFLDSIQTGTKLLHEPSPTKRRRTSSTDGSHGVTTQHSPELSQALRRATFVLQLVDSSDPVSHPELLHGLFTVLSEIQHCRTTMGSELGYLQNLILRSLLAIMPAYHSNKALKIDSSGGYGDLLVNCIQKSSSPVLQNSALLLIASLAKTAPMLVLHSVMPIFTFMGSSILRQNDDYSAHVVSQTIKEVIPPLIESLRQGKKDPIVGASDILLSFSTAYEHVPQHRRQGLYVALVETLGPQEFCFALIGMLADRYDANEALLKFLVDFFSSFTIQVQLQTLSKFLDLTYDLFQQKPHISYVLLGNGEDAERRNVEELARRQLSAFSALLTNKKLRSQISQLEVNEGTHISDVRELYARLVENILCLADTLKANKNLHSQCGVALADLLNLLSIGEFIKAVETLLGRRDLGLRQKVLRALEARMDTESNTRAESRKVLLAFLPYLTAAITESSDMRYKHTAVACIDKISEKYGKKDVDAVVAAASVVAGPHCLGHKNQKLRVMALLCLTSLVDVLQDGIVPVLPIAIPIAVSYLDENIRGDEAEEQLHAACYSFVSSIAEHLPYMLPTHLGKILEVSSKSAEMEMSTETVDSRVSCLSIVARCLPAKETFSGINASFEVTEQSGVSAIHELIEMFGVAINKHTKSSIAKYASLLLSIILKALDVRRKFLGDDTAKEAAVKEIAPIEQSINETGLRAIYKLNDAAFRPLFVQMIEWGSSGLGKKDKRGRFLRQYSLYGFMLHFFGQLKSIVTSYATHVVDDAVSILKSVNVKVMEERELWSRVLNTLATCFMHDQDEFWQAPAHFDAVAPVLLDQFALEEQIDTSKALIPAVVELAVAADSQTHHKELNTALMKHLRSEQATVRLAAVRCEQALTERVGEEWLATLHETLPRISELQEDDDEVVERETHRWIVKIEGVLGESLDAMLQ